MNAKLTDKKIEKIVKKRQAINDKAIAKLSAQNDKDEADAMERGKAAG